MATPNSSISQLGLSDVNVELNHPAATARRFDDAIFRNLTGVQAKTVLQSPILMSDVSDKAAFDGIISPISANSSDFGIVTAQVNLTADSDMVSPDVVWSYSVITGTGNIVFQPDGGKNAVLRLISDVPGVQTANVQVNVAVSFAGHEIGTESRYIALATEVFNPNLQLSGTLSVNNSGFVAQTATTTITATSNVAVGQIRFLTSPPFGGTIQGNTITFNSSATTPGVDNNNIYTLTTELLYNNTVIATNTVNVATHAIYNQPDLILTAPVSQNNVFANSGPIDSSIRVTASHAVPGANVVWTQTVVSGDTPTFTVAANNAFANSTLSVATFGARKSVVDIKASLQFSNGYILNEKTQRLTLRTVGYGLSFTGATDYTAQGYGAQTATSSATATYQAGTFTWDYAQTSGPSATVTQSIGPASASFAATVYANTPSTAVAVLRINPVITFDGIVIANTSSITTLTAEFTPFTFNVTGPTVNNQVGDSPVTSSSLTTAAHTVANGYVLWTRSNANVTFSSNTSAANCSITANNSVPVHVETTTLNGQLFDQYNRFVAEAVRTITLRSFAPNIQFFGANSNSNTGYSPPQQASVSIEARAVTGANSFSISNAKLAGDDLTITNFNSNTTYDRVDFLASTDAIGTVSGTYRITATVNYFGATHSKTYDVTASASLLNSNYTLTSSNSVVASYLSPVTANGQANATHTVPGGTIQWGAVTQQGVVFDVPVANNSIYRFRTQRTSIGTTNTVVAVTGTLLDQDGLVVKSLTTNVRAEATLSDPQLALAGSNNVNVSNTFQATAATTLTASVAAGVVGETFQFTTTKISGVNATITPGATDIDLSIVANGVETVSATYDVKVDAVLSGQIIATLTRRVVLTATATSPVINFSSANNTAANFNFPVNAAGVVQASSTPASTVEFVAMKVSGSNLTVQILANQVNLSASQSDIGATDGTYDVVATYKTPAGFVITTRTARVNVRAERYNPGFVWDYLQGTVVEKRGWEENITAVGQVQATANAALTGHTFVINGQFVSGAAGSTFGSTTNTATITLPNNRTTNGTAPREVIWDLTASLERSGQTLAGPFTRRITVRTVPYVLSLNPLNPSDFSLDSVAAASTVASSNHEAFAATTITWTTAMVSGDTPSITIGSSGGINNRITASLAPPANQGTRTGTITVTAHFFANSADRTVSTNITVSAESSESSGSCVCEDMWLDAMVRAGDAKEEQLYMTWSPEDAFRYEKIQKIGEIVEAPCVEITTKTGAVLRCSKTTPFNLETAKTDLDEGHYVYADELLGQFVLVDNYGMLFWDEVVSVEDIGIKRVVPISFGGRSFAAGDSRMAMIYSHNMAKYIP